MFKKPFRRVWPLLTLLALSSLALGLSRGEFAIVNRWAHTLCTACIGLGR